MREPGMGGNPWAAVRAALVVGMVCLLGGAEVHAQDVWATPDRDGQRSRHAAGRGAITRPALGWELPIGGSVGVSAILVADLDGDAVPEATAASRGIVLSRRVDDALLWDTPPVGVGLLQGLWDFDGDGVPELLGVGRVIAILDGRTGLARWTFEHPNPDRTLNNPSVIPTNLDGDPEPELLIAYGPEAAIRMFDFGAGYDRAREVWASTAPTLPARLSRFVLGDFDGDGQDDEIGTVSQSYCEVTFLDARTGEVLLATPRTATGEYCYGQMQAANVDDDPRAELLFSDDNGLSNTLAVFDLGLGGAQWQVHYRLRDLGTTVLTTSQMAVDLDGQAPSEVVLSVYGDVAEQVDTPQDGIDNPGVWTTLVLDGETGAVKASRIDERIVGVFDVDLDGDVELVTASVAPGAFAAPQWGTLRFWHLGAGGELVLGWELPNARPIIGVDRAEPDREHYDNGSRLVGFDHDDDGRPNLLVLRRSGPGAATVRLSLLAFGAAGAVSALAEAPLSALHDYGIIGGGQSEGIGRWIAINSTASQALVFDATLAPLAEASVFSGTSAIVAGALGDGRAEVVFTGSGNNLVVADASGANFLQAPVRTLERRGFGGSRFQAFDVDGDGVRELLWASAAETGAHFVALLDLDGAPRWQIDIPEAVAPPHSFVVGQFGGSDALDLVFLNGTIDLTPQVRRVDGATGVTTIRATPSDAGRYPNQAAFRVDDVDGDGYDDLVVLHWITWEVLSGQTLARIGVVRRLPTGLSSPRPSALISGDASPALFVNATNNGKALVDPLDGTFRWTVSPEPSQQGQLLAQPGFADVNTDGFPDIAVPGIYADVTVYDGLTGAILHRLCLDGGALRELAVPATADTCTSPTAVSAISAADIDGDGRDEWLVGTAQGFLFAIDGPGATLDWTLELRTPLDAPTPVDIDQDGLLEVLVSTSDARIVMVDQAELASPQGVREVAIDASDAIVNPASDVDVSDRWDALGLAWDAVPGATRYVYTLVSENGNQVIPWTDAGNLTELVRTGLSLVPGIRYVVQVIAFDEVLGASSIASSDGVLITPGPPTVLLLTATPDPFSPSVGEVTTIKGQVAATPTTSLVRYELTIVSPRAEVVATWARTVDTRSLELLQDWDGLDADLRPHLDGEYGIRLTVVDSNGNAQVGTTTVTIVSEQMPEDVGPPDAELDVDADQPDLPDEPDLADDPDVELDPDADDADSDPPDVAEDVPDSPDVVTDPLDPSSDDLVPGADGFQTDADNAGAYNLPEDGCCSCRTPAPAPPAPPMTLALLGAAALGLGLWRRR